MPREKFTPRIFIEGDFCFSKNQITSIKLDEVELQFLKVIRAKPDDLIELHLITKNQIFLTQIVFIKKSSIEVKIIDDITEKFIPKNNIKISLMFSIGEKETIRDILDYSTQTDIIEFFPILTEFSKEYSLKFLQKKGKTIIKESIRQNKRLYFPHLNNPKEIKKLSPEFFSSFDTIIIADPNPPEEKLFKPKKKFKNILLIIGPESGFSQKDIEIFSNIIPKDKLFYLTFSKTIIRSKIAPIVFSSFILGSLFYLD